MEYRYGGGIIELGVYGEWGVNGVKKKAVAQKATAPSFQSHSKSLIKSNHFHTLILIQLYTSKLLLIQLPSHSLIHTNFSYHIIKSLHRQKTLV